MQQVFGRNSLWDQLPLSAISKKSGYHWFVVLTVCIGAFMAALDASIVNIALPALQQQFHIGMNAVEWVSLVYLLTLASLIVTFGRIADMFGRRWMYASGFLVFMISSFLCGVSSGLSALLLWRVFQAVGAAMLQANSVAIITAITPSGDRGKAIGIQASAQGIGLTLGPALGGAIITYLDWRWLFFVNIPIGIFGIILAFLLLPKDKTKSSSRHFDYWGFLFLTPSLIGLIYVLSMGTKQGWTSPLILLCISIAFIGFAAFVREEQRSKAPLVDFTLFRNPSFTYGSITGVLSFTMLYAVLLLTPYFIESILHVTTITSGLILTIIPFGMTLFTPISGMIADKFGIRAPTIIGMSFASTGCMLLACIGGSYTYFLLVTGLFLLGVGMGTFTPPNNSSVMGSAPSSRLGVAGGILNMARTFGMGFGVTFGGLFYQLFFSLNTQVHKTGEQAMIPAFRYTYFTITLLGIAALIISATRKQTNQPHPDFFIGEGI